MSRLSFTSSGRGRRLTPTASAIVLLDLFAMAVPVAAQERLTVDASASVGIATNPFLQSGSTPVAINPTIGVHPIWTRESPLTTLQVEADLQAAFYNRGYGTNSSVTVQGSGTHKLSEYTTLGASVSYLNSIVGIQTDFRVPVGTVVPVGAVLPDVLIDPALGGIGQRRQAYQASSNIVTLLSARDQIELAVEVSLNRLEGTGFNNFNYASPSFSYTRSLSEKASIGARLGVGFSNYLGTTVGDATIYQPVLTGSRIISERWTLKGSLGAAIVNLNEPFGQTNTTTSLNGAADLCRRDARWTACFTLSRQTVPSAFQGVRTQNSIAATLGYRLNEKDDLSIIGSYSHASGPLQRNTLGTVNSESVDFANASVNYTHRFRPTLSGFGNLGYAKAFDGFGRDANVTVVAGVTYRFNGL